MNTIYKNNLYLICLSFLVIISNSSCGDADIGLQPKNKDMQKITATEEKKKMFEEVAEKLKEAGSSVEEFSRYCGGEARGSGMTRWTMSEEDAEHFRWIEEEERKRIKAKEEALERVDSITSEEERDKLYKEIAEAVRESVRMDVGKGKSDELDVSLIEGIFILQIEKLRGALKADPYFFHLDRDCFVPDKTLRTKNFEMEDAYLDIVKQYMGYDPFDIVDY